MRKSSNTEPKAYSIHNQHMVFYRLFISYTYIVPRHLYIRNVYVCVCCVTSLGAASIGILREGDDGVAPHILRRPLRLYAIQNPPRPMPRVFSCHFTMEKCRG